MLETDGERRARVLLLCGGQSPEHWVSLASGRCCAHAIDRRRWDVEVACILSDGLWMVPKRGLSIRETVAQMDRLFDLMEYPDFSTGGFVNLWSVGQAVDYLLGDGRPDVILPLTHGARGEDGVLQGLLEFLGIPFVGSGVLASALAMDKIRTLELVASHGIRTPRRVVVGPGRQPWNPEEVAQIVTDHLGWPVFVKPSNGGSSLATAEAATPVELAECVEQASALDRTVLIEERVRGREVTCGVIEIAGWSSASTDESVDLPAIHRVACPPTQIRPLHCGFFDYESKYRPGASEEITPAPFPAEVVKKIQEVADRAHLVLGCRGLSRTDMIVTEGGDPVFLETNTLPGMTVTSLLPQGARAVGLDMTQLLSALLDGCLANAAGARRSWHGASVAC
jgi:D-alanine-D-alanine ligase